MTSPGGIPGSFPSSSAVPLRPNPPVSRNAAANNPLTESISAADVAPPAQDAPPAGSTPPVGVQPPTTGSTPQSRRDTNRMNSIMNAWSVYTLTKEIRPDGLQKLTGSENYCSWRDLMRLLLKNLYLSDCLTDTMDIRVTDDISKKNLRPDGRCPSRALWQRRGLLHISFVTWLSHSYAICGGICSVRMHIHTNVRS